MCESAEKEGGMYACVMSYVSVLYGVSYVMEYTALEIKG